MDEGSAEVSDMWKQQQKSDHPLALEERQTGRQVDGCLDQRRRNPGRVLPCAGVMSKIVYL